MHSTFPMRSQNRHNKNESITRRKKSGNSSSNEYFWRSIFQWPIQLNGQHTIFIPNNSEKNFSIKYFLSIILCKLGRNFPLTILPFLDLIFFVVWYMHWGNNRKKKKRDKLNRLLNCSFPIFFSPFIVRDFSKLQQNRNYNSFSSCILKLFFDFLSHFPVRVKEDGKERK